MTKVSPQNTATARLAEAPARLDFPDLLRLINNVGSIANVINSACEDLSGVDLKALHWLGQRLDEQVGALMVWAEDAQQVEA
ncbi:MAG TPA: hypothetical protein VK196_00210 [Magnetospirillum sp.]|nr:hypothetical protein [Magnetospirillum sp.]